MPKAPVSLRATVLALFSLLLLAGSARAESYVFVFFDDGAAAHDGRTLARLASFPSTGATEAVGAPGEGFFLVGPSGVQALTPDLEDAGLIALPAAPRTAQYLAGRQALLVAAQDRLYWINAATHAVEAELAPGLTPDGLLAAPGAARAYVLSRATRQVALVDLEARTVLAQNLWLPEPPSEWVLGEYGRALAAAGGSVFDLDRLTPSAVAPPVTAQATPPALQSVALPAPGNLAAIADGSLLLTQPTGYDASAIAAAPDGGLFLASSASARLLRLQGEETVAEVALPAPARALSVVAPVVRQEAPGSLIQQFGSGQTVTAGEPFQIGVRALNYARVPIIGLSVNVTSVEPTAAAVVCQPSVTDIAGVGTINCTASGTGENLDLQLTVKDALGRQAPPFSVSIEQPEEVDGLRVLTGDVINTPRNNVFQIVARAMDDGKPQAGLRVTVNAAPAYPLLSCPSLHFTDVDGFLNILCRANNVDAPASSTVTISDELGRRVAVTVVVTPHITLGDGPHKTSGDGQTVNRHGVLPTPLVITAYEGGLPRDRVQLDISTSSNLLFCPSHAFTNSLGQAIVLCSAGATTATSFVQVFVTDPEGRTLDSPFLITVVPIDPGSAEDLILHSAETLEGPAGVAIPDAIRVTAVDDEGDPVPGAPVYFATSGDVSFEPSVAVTDERGDASITVTPGCPARPDAIRVGLGGDGSVLQIPLRVTAGEPRIIAKVQGDLQQGDAGELLDDEALVIELTDICGNKIPGRPVDWSVSPAGAATLENIVVPTDSKGRSSTLVRLGDRAGRFQVMARSGDLAVTFSLAVTQIPTRVTLVGGDNQTIRRNQTAPQELAVRVTDQDGGPIADFPIRFAVTAGEAILTDAVDRTSADGIASVILRAGDQVGRVNVTASVRPGAPPELFHIFRLDVIGDTPAASSGAFVNGASFSPGWTPGAIGTIFGTNLMSGVDGVIGAGPAPFPTDLRGVRVTVNGVPAPLVALADSNGQQQINVQVPFELDAAEATVELDNNGAVATVSGVALNAVQPGIFEVADVGSRIAAALHADFRPVTRADPALPGETILLYVTGLGAVDPPAPTNTAGPNPPARPVAETIVGLDDEGVEVLGAFYAPGLIGTYQINFVVPADADAGDLKLTVVSGGVGSQTSILPVGTP